MNKQDRNDLHTALGLIEDGKKIVQTIMDKESVNKGSEEDQSKKNQQALKEILDSIDSASEGLAELI